MLLPEKGEAPSFLLHRYKYYSVKLEISLCKLYFGKSEMQSFSSLGHQLRW